MKAVVNYGSDDVVELTGVPGRGTVLLPFTRADVPSVDIKGGTLTVVLPEEDEGAPEGDGAPS